MIMIVIDRSIDRSLLPRQIRFVLSTGMPLAPFQSRCMPYAFIRKALLRKLVMLGSCCLWDVSDFMTISLYAKMTS